MLLFGVVRRLPRTWWIWGAAVTAVFFIFTVLISPVYIVPIFNKVTRLDDPKIVDPILSMARANGIPAKDVYEIDASRQTTRISANVSGFANTMRITLMTTFCAAARRRKFRRSWDTRWGTTLCITSTTASCFCRS